jgi:hypothetical protein
MTTDSRTITFQQTTDAQFRAWVAAIIDQLIDIGLTQTADTGQIDTATVTAPVATNTQQGYAVFRFNDTAHATRPLFFRLGFGSGSATTTPAITFTLGTGSDGAGTITGVLRAALQRNGTASAVGLTTYACYDASTGILWAQWVGSSTWNLIIARSCDRVTELPDDKGVVNNWTATTTTDLEFAPWSTSVFANLTFTAPSAGSQAYVDESSRPLVFPFWGFCPTGEVGFFTIPGLLMTYGQIWPSGLEVTVAPAGVDRVYKALTNSTYFAGAWSIASLSAEKLLQVWE